MTRSTEARLALLYRIAHNLNSSLDLEGVLNRAIDEVIAATHAERGFIVLVGELGRNTFEVARGIDQSSIASPEFEVSRSVVERVVHDGQPLLTSDARSDAWLGKQASVAGLGLRSILCVPLRVQDRVLGVVYVDNRLQAGIFTAGDLDLLSSIAATAAIAIENARLYRLAVEQGRMERELQMARQVQVSLLPHQLPELPGWEFAAYWQPATEVAGDFYDFIPGDHAGSLGIAIGDVSGKGMPAALFMANSRAILRGALAASPGNPAEGITRANRLICADSPHSMFVTLFFALLAGGSGQVTYVNAGHNPPLLCQARLRAIEPLRSTGLLMGVIEEATFEQDCLQLEPGDALLLYTDGLTEALDELGEQFGEERLHEVLVGVAGAGAAEMLAAVKDALAAHAGAVEPTDDVTLLVARWRGGGQ